MKTIYISNNSMQKYPKEEERNKIVEVLMKTISSIDKKFEFEEGKL